MAAYRKRSKTELLLMIAAGAHALTAAAALVWRMLSV